MASQKNKNEDEDYDDKPQIEWQWRLFKSKKLVSGTKQIRYHEDAPFFGIVSGTCGFFVTAAASWLINTHFLPRPPSSDFIGHMGFWLAEGINKLTFGLAYRHEVNLYHAYINWLNEQGLSYIIGFRMFLASIAGGVAGIYGFARAYKNTKPVSAKDEKHDRGGRLWEGEEAERRLTRLMEKEVARSSALGRISDKLFLSIWRATRHVILIGASGTGKSQWLAEQIIASMQQGLKSFILDPKYEFTAAFYREDDASMAILDPTDARSHVWDIAYDLSKLGQMKKMSASLIPESNDPMWASAARAIFTGLLYFLRKLYGKSYTWRDLSDLIPISVQERAFIMKHYYPDALDFVAKIDPDTGETESNVTHEGININVKAFMDGVRDIGRFWYKPDQPRFSLFEFMTNPHYPIKTLFLKPNDSEEMMSNMIVRGMLSYAISLMDSPHVLNSDNPVGCFFLDEFHAPGKLLTASGKPVINNLIQRGRSKGWSGFLTVQNLIDFYKVYSKEDVQGWRETSSTFLLTGAPLAETAKEVSDFIGEQFIDKLHKSISYQNDGSSTSENYQEHNRKIILPSEIANKLNPDDTHIHYLALLRGAKDVYIIKKPFINIKPVVPEWVEQDELDSPHNPDSRVVKFIKEGMKKEKEGVSQNIGSNSRTITPPPPPTLEAQPFPNKWVPAEDEVPEADADIEWEDTPDMTMDDGYQVSAVDSLEELLANASQGDGEDLDSLSADEMVRHAHFGDGAFHMAPITTATQIIDNLVETEKHVTGALKKGKERGPELVFHPPTKR